MIQDPPINVPLNDASGLVSPQWALWLMELKNISQNYQFDNVFSVSSGTFTSNSPSAGYVAWDKVKVKYNGVLYAVSTNGNTDKKYIYWEPTTPRVLSSSNTIPVTSEYLVLVGINDTGTFTPGAYTFEARVLAGLNADGTVADDKAVSGSIASKNIEDYHLDDGAVMGSSGDPTAPHFTYADLTLDGAWHDLDLSSIVPAGKNFVQLHVYLSAALTPMKIAYFRPNGNVNTVNVASVVANVGMVAYADIIVPLDSARVIEYHVTSGDVTLEIVVGGWLT